MPRIKELPLRDIRKPASRRPGARFPRNVVVRSVDLNRWKMVLALNALALDRMPTTQRAKELEAVADEMLATLTGKGWTAARRRSLAIARAYHGEDATF